MWNNQLKFNEKGEVINTKPIEQNNSEYSYDNRIKKIWRERRKAGYESENQRFKNWCNTFINPQENDLCYGDLLASLYNKTFKSVRDDGYFIKNKEFKDELATLIYKESYINE